VEITERLAVSPFLKLAKTKISRSITGTLRNGLDVFLAPWCECTRLTRSVGITRARVYADDRLAYRSEFVVI